MRKKKNKFIFICIVLMILCILASVSTRVHAESALLPSEDLESNESEKISETQDRLLEDFDFDELNQSLRELLPASKLRFGDLLQNILQGDFGRVKETFRDTLKDQFAYELRYQKQTLVHILLLAIVAAVFTNFSSAFQNKQISETSFYILYMLLIALALSSFQVAIVSVETGVNQIMEFMEVLCPSYFLAVALATGGSTSIVFYNIVLFVIYLVELLIISIILPAIHIYIMVQMLNYLSEEDYLTQLAELIEKGISWILKAMLAFVIGINMIQRLLTPAIDSLKRSLIGRSAEAIPVVGDALSGSADILLGSAVLIKNSIGIVGACICTLLCIIPLIKMLLMVFMYKLACALIQPISDKRITGCLDSISHGSELLVRVLYTSGILFLITIAVVASTTTGG